MHVSDNAVADALSRLSTNALHTDDSSPVVDFRALALAQVDDPDLLCLQSDSSLRLEEIPLALSDDIFIICDVSTGTQRPFVPASFRRAIFDCLHSMSHPGVRATQRMVTSRFVWPHIYSDVRKWARACLHYQRSKVHRHTTTPLATFATPDARIDQVHVDLVGPLPPSNGCVYLLTCVDRFTRWPEAISILDSTAKTVARGFVETWISRFGVPSTVTTDHGPQFTSHLWEAFTQLLGTKHIHTTAYYPITNGLVEHFHRQLKAALKASPHPDRWTDMLPLALLGIRTSLKEDIKGTAAELVYGTSLRLPGEFFIRPVDSSMDPTSYITQLKSTMQALRSMATRKQVTARSHIDSSLHSTSHVFVHHDAVKKPLQQPYNGPYHVLDRAAKFYTLDLNCRKDSVSIDRLKPAHLHTPVLGSYPDTNE